MILDAHGLRIELPTGWSGKLLGRAGGIASLHFADFPLAISDGDFGGASTALMPAAGTFVALNEYLPGAGLTPGVGLYAPRRIPRRLDPTAFSAGRLAHPRPGQQGMQHFFTTARRPFCLYVVIAGERAERRRRLPVLDAVLATLRVGNGGLAGTSWPSA